MNHPNSQFHTLSGCQWAWLRIKRVLDFLIAFAALLVLLVPFTLLALIIFLDDPGPVFFCQKRVGRNQKHFTMLKFRTMRTDTPRDIPTHLLENPQQYITRVGRLLRRTSLDELPQLLNILAGQMSIVGPRPALPNQTDLNEARDAYGVHQVLPGLTGWAQVNGRDELEIPVKAGLDAEYVRNFGLRMDLKCLFTTIGVVATGKGVVEGGTGELARKGADHE